MKTNYAALHAEFLFGDILNNYIGLFRKFLYEIGALIADIGVCELLATIYMLVRGNNHYNRNKGLY